MNRVHFAADERGMINRENANLMRRLTYTERGLRAFPRGQRQAITMLSRYGDPADAMLESAFADTIYLLIRNGDAALWLGRFLVHFIKGVFVGMGMFTMEALLQGRIRLCEHLIHALEAIGIEFN